MTIANPTVQVRGKSFEKIAGVHYEANDLPGSATPAWVDGFGGALPYDLEEINPAGIYHVQDDANVQHGRQWILHNAITVNPFTGDGSSTVGKSVYAEARIQVVSNTWNFNGGDEAQYLIFWIQNSSSPFDERFFKIWTDRLVANDDYVTVPWSDGGPSAYYYKPGTSWHTYKVVIDHEDNEQRYYLDGSLLTSHAISESGTVAAVYLWTAAVLANTDYPLEFNVDYIRCGTVGGVRTPGVIHHPTLTHF